MYSVSVCVYVLDFFLYCLLKYRINFANSKSQTQKIKERQKVYDIGLGSQLPKSSSLDRKYNHNPILRNPGTADF